jgi:Lamin Tail Domain/Bacterial Ig domain
LLSFAAAKDSNEIGSPGAIAASGGIVVTEVAPWSSGNSPFKADWFELTNTSTVAIDITGWKVDDNSKDFTKAVALSGITTIAAGESVIFLESASATTAAQFIDTWFGGVAPAGLKIGTYTGSGIGLSNLGDQVNIYDAAGALKADVTFGASPTTAPYATFDNTKGLNGTTLTALSTIGTNGAFAAVKDANEIGSPGNLAPVAPSNQAPTAITLSNVTASIAENTNTATRIKVADVTVTDDGLGTNQLAVTGADARFFEVDSTGLYIKAGTTLDYEAQRNYSVTVTVDDTTVGTTPDASTAYTLVLTDVSETPPPANRPPVASADAITVRTDATTNNLWSVLLANDIDPEGGALRISAVETNGTLGTVQFDAQTQTLRYVADDASFDQLPSGEVALDSFSYTIVDAQGLSSTATVQVSVSGTPQGTTGVFLAPGDVLTGLTFGGNVYGSTGNEGVTYLSGVRGAVIDQNVELVGLADAFSTFAYQQQGNNLVLFDRQSTAEVARIVLQDDADGTTIRFSDGIFQATVSADGMKIGSTVVSTAPPATTAAISAFEAVELLSHSSYADLQIASNVGVIG